MTKATQCDRIVAFCDAYGSITSLDAFVELGCTRLASRIFDLTERGYAFSRVTETRNNRFGEPVRYTRYAIERRPHEQST